MTMRLFLIALLFVIFSAVLIVPTHSSATQPGTVWVWCVSDPSQPTVYFSSPFDSGMNANTSFNGLSLGRQFTEYLRGRFDAKGEASCTHGARVNQAGAAQRVQEYMAQMRQQNKQIVEVPDWNYVRDEVAIKASFNTPREQGAYVDVEGGLPSNHIYCVAGPSNNTIYYAEPIPLTDPNYNPSVEYFNLLQHKYSFKGTYDGCKIISEPHAKLYLNARLAGARAGGKQVVNTGWPPATSTSTAQVANARYKDNDQPSQRPATNQPAPSNQVRDFAAKEVTPALTYCHSNRAMGRSYDCACLQAKIYDYRIKHPAETLQGTPTLASFFEGKEFQCDQCLIDPYAKVVAHDAAYAAGLKSPAALDCAEQKFVAALHAKPIPSQAQAELDTAIKTCRQ